MTIAPPDDATAAVSIRTELVGRRLPNWAVPSLLVGSLVVGLLMMFAGLYEGIPLALVWAVIIFCVAQTVWSFLIEGRRHAVDRLVTTAVYSAFVLALIPLIAILFTVIVKGISVIKADFFSNTMRNVSPRLPGGGVAHALVGTIEQVLMATLIAVPIGVLVAVYLVEYGRGRLALSISFFVDVMTGVPSIVAGLFIYTGLILTFGMQRSGFAASLALVLLMLPVVVRTTEEMLKLVPSDLREASYALGVPKWKTILRIVIPTALPGIITGGMLAVARVAGETAPLLLTTFLTQSMNWNLFSGPQAALPTFIWDQISTGNPVSINRAWGGAFVLILFVAVLYIGARVVARIFAPKAR